MNLRQNKSKYLEKTLLHDFVQFKNVRLKNDLELRKWDLKKTNILKCRSSEKKKKIIWIDIDWSSNTQLERKLFIITRKLLMK
jgi:hypothetical protein